MPPAPTSGELAGQVAVVTGASRGIGEAVAVSLVRQGAQVVITSRREQGIRDAATRIRNAVPGADVLPLAAHAAEPGSAERVMSSAVDAYGPVKILVNNAATNPYMGPATNIDPERAEKTTAVNMLAPLSWARAAIDAGLDRGGAIVNISSVGGLRIDPMIGYYNATKAALIHLTRQLAWELGPTVRVNAVAPGLVRTELARALWETRGDDIAAALPLRRLGTVDDIAEAALFLAGPRSSWITGETLVVDGGALVNPSVQLD